ncbi:MAG: MATE family efflux transporter, partial [Pseudomonadota bacterium]
RGYLYAISWGMPGIFAYLSLRFTSEGIGHTRPIMFIALIGLATNIAGNYVLMYGKLGFPAMGAVGCGYASAINMYVMLAAMAFYVRSTPGVYGRYALFERFTWPQWPVCRELLWLGLPIGIGIVAEVALFSGSSLLMGTLGVDAAAAHQISINYAATMFMVPMGISSAMVIHIGQALGRQEFSAARTAGIAGTVMCGAFMAVSALAMLVFKEQIIAIYTSEPSVRVIAISLIALAAVFQVADGVQVGAIGALRGYKDTKIPMLLNFVSFWAIGLVWAWQSGIVRGNGPTGIWMAMVVALFAAAVFNVARFQWVSRRRLVSEPELQQL